MKIFIFIIIGIVGGLIGGMGMGGGTFLIPLLTIFTGTPQHVAQAVNLIAFVPMSVVALIIHAKNKLLDYKYLLIVALPASLASIPSVMLARKVSGENLGKYFGVFLIILGVYQLTCVIIAAVKSRKKTPKN